MNTATTPKCILYRKHKCEIFIQFFLTLWKYMGPRKERKVWVLLLRPLVDPPLNLKLLKQFAVLELNSRLWFTLSPSVRCHSRVTFFRSPSLSHFSSIPPPYFIIRLCYYRLPEWIIIVLAAYIILDRYYTSK